MTTLSLADELRSIGAAFAKVITAAENRKLVLATAVRPPLPYHLAAKRYAQRLVRDRSQTALMAPWAAQNLKESAVRTALRLHRETAEFGAQA